MFLFIFESIGTSELLLIGVVALIFLGPRKLPEMARKVGKMMSEFRSTTSEFKETWQREVNFEEEAKALNIGDIEADAAVRDHAIPPGDTVGPPTAPLIREADPSQFVNVIPTTVVKKEGPEAPDANDKATWL